MHTEHASGPLGQCAVRQWHARGAGAIHGCSRVPARSAPGPAGTRCRWLVLQERWQSTPS